MMDQQQLKQAGVQSSRLEKREDERYQGDPAMDDSFDGGGSLLMNTFDEKIFFSIPSFDAEVFRTAREEICARIEGQLSRLEQEEGLDVYQKYVFKEKDQRIQRLSKDQIEEQIQIQKSLDDAFVKGNPRGYQRMILEVAKSKNTIVNLGTGLGKTLIALMCIQDMSSSYEQEDKKQTLFLVPSVALAIQQTLTLRANLPKFSIATACFAIASSKTARRELAVSNVIVATHGAVRTL